MENPDYLILDEPFNGLDQDGVEDVHQLLQKLKKEGKCILLASHSATDISKACDEVYKIKEGKIIIKDIEVNGTENLLKILGNDTRIVTIFLKVGKEELKRRLIERGDNIQDIEVRLGRLEYEEDKIKLYDYVIKNDDFEKTVQVIMTIIENEKRIEDERV